MEPGEPSLACLPQIAFGLQRFGFARQAIQFLRMYERVAFVADEGARRQFAGAASAVSDQLRSNAGHNSRSYTRQTAHSSAGDNSGRWPGRQLKRSIERRACFARSLPCDADSDEENEQADRSVERISQFEKGRGQS